MTTQTATSLFAPYQLGPIALANRIVMAPLTRSRAIGNVPNALMAEYYGQRAAAGLIVTEGTSPSPNGLGYARIPGLYSPEQIAGWKLVTDAVHAKGGKIFVQLMHCGRIGHDLNLPAGAEVVGPSAIAAAGQIWTDQSQMQAHPTPREMSEADIQQAIGEYAQAAKNAIEAGFDGVEVHGANGYLIDQFLNPAANQRTDGWGGAPEGLVRFAVEVAKAAVAAIGSERVGIRVSPYGAFNDVAPHDATHATQALLAQQLGALKLAYIHVVDHSGMGAPEVKPETKAAIRANFGGPYIMSGGYDRARAESDLAADKGELVAFGVPFLANPDLVARLEQNAALNTPDQATFYLPGPAGYTDYPTL